MRKSILGAIVCAGAGFGVAPPTEAAIVQISGLVDWGAGTPFTLFSAPGASSSFSFDLPNPISSNPTDQATHFSYLTEGKQVIDPLVPTFVTVRFLAAGFAGLFDLTVRIRDTVDVVSFFGPDIGTSLTLDTGTFSAAAGVDLLSATGSGTLSVSQLGITSTGAGAGAVPEPSTWVMMTLGFAGLALVGYRTLRKRVPVAKST
jgi:hypothetical protein